MSSVSLPFEPSSNPLLSPACQLFCSSYKSSLLSPYLQQRERFYTSSAWSQLLSTLSSSCTLYIGNLSFFTTEQQLYEYFSRCGRITRLVMGLNSQTHVPAGFCFIVFSSHREAENARLYLRGSCVDERKVIIDLDMEFEEGRQWGRSKSGGQIKDEFRQSYDAERGGWSVWQKKQKELQQRMNQQQTTSFQSYESKEGTEIGAGGGGYIDGHQLNERSNQSYALAKKMKLTHPTASTTSSVSSSSSVIPPSVSSSSASSGLEVSYDEDEPIVANSINPNGNENGKEKENMSYDEEEEEEEENSNRTNTNTNTNTNTDTSTSNDTVSYDDDE